MIDDDPGNWTCDEIDEIVRDTVGEIAPDRFDELLRQTMIVTDQPENPLARTRSRGTPRSGLRSTGWLSAAAAVVAVGSVGVLMNRPSPGDVTHGASRPAPRRAQ